MKTAEIKAFAQAYAKICAYVSKVDAESIATMLANNVDEEVIYEKYFDATSVIDAYLLWEAAKQFAEEVTA
jgi:phage gp36-like protein